MGDAKAWEKEMISRYTKYSGDLSYDITGFYLELQRIAKKYLESGEMKEGDSFSFNTTDKARFVYRFYKNTSELERVSEDGKVSYKNEIRCDSTAKEEYNFLKIIGEQLNVSGNCIGNSTPREFGKLLEKLTEGQVISFTDGKSYLCTENKNGFLNLVGVFEGDVRNFSLKALRNREKRVVDLANPNDIRKFYLENKKYYTERIEYNFTTLDTARIEIKKIENSLGRNEINSFHFGNFDLVAKKNMLGSNVNWYDNSGKIVDVNDVVNAFALLSNKLRKREYIWKGEKNEYINYSLEKELEMLQKNRYYAKMFEKISEEVLANGENLEVDTHFYEKGNAGFVPKTISFVNVDGRIKAFCSYYKGNNFENGKDPDRILEIGKDEFVAMCEYMYSENFNVIKTREEENYERQYKKGSSFTETQKRIIENAAISKAIANSGIVFGKVGYSKNNIETLVSQFIKEEGKICIEDINSVLKERGEDYE